MIFLILGLENCDPNGRDRGQDHLNTCKFFCSLTYKFVWFIASILSAHVNIVCESQWVHFAWSAHLVRFSPAASFTYFFHVVHRSVIWGIQHYSWPTLAIKFSCFAFQMPSLQSCRWDLVCAVVFTQKWFREKKLLSQLHKLTEQISCRSVRVLDWVQELVDDHACKPFNCDPLWNDTLEFSSRLAHYYWLERTCQREKVGIGSLC